MTELTERQEKLLMMRDYFKLLKDGIEGESHYRISEEDKEKATWMEVLMTECESDVMHLHTGQPEYCRFIEVEIPDLREAEIDI